MREAKIREFLRGAEGRPAARASLPAAATPPDPDLEQWIRELTGEAEPPADRSIADWEAAAAAVVKVLLASPDASPERSRWLLLDEIVHRSLAPGAKPRRRALEMALASELGAAGRLDVRVFLLRMLALAGSGAAVPAIERMLAEPDPVLRHYALRALEANPSAQAGQAIIAALLKAESAEHRADLARALGSRREAAAAAGLKRMLDAETDAAARRALRRALAATGAVELIDSPRGEGDPAEAAEILKARLLAAERRRTAGRAADAFAECEEVLRRAEERHVRLAALRGLVLSGPEKSVPHLVKALGGDDEGLRIAASRLVLELKSDAALSSLRESLQPLPAPARALVEDAIERALKGEAE